MPPLSVYIIPIHTYMLMYIHVHACIHAHDVASFTFTQCIYIPVEFVCIALSVSVYRSTCVHAHTHTHTHTSNHNHASVHVQECYSVELHSYIPQLLCLPPYIIAYIAYVRSFLLNVSTIISSEMISLSQVFNPILNIHLPYR